MKMQDIHMRDPFILVHDGKYYLYGTRGPECWTFGYGLDVYVSDDMENWTDAIEVFSKPEGFWADRNFWAPEVHLWKGSFYMFVTFKSESECRGTQILKADSPTGPFRLHSDGPVTPRDWECLDGTLYVDPEGHPYIVFCHEWLQVHDGEMCAMRLADDLSAAIEEPHLLFRASEPEWAVKNATDFITDGPYMYRTQNNSLLMLWSTNADNGYCECIARSDNGDILGNWSHEKLLFSENGGHGMIFRTLEGQLKFIYHQPNKKPLERPHMLDLIEKDDSIDCPCV